MMEKEGCESVDSIEDTGTDSSLKKVVIWN